MVATSCEQILEQNYYNFAIFQHGCLQQGPGPCDGHQEERYDQQHQHHHDPRHDRDVRLATWYSRILFQAVSRISWPRNE